MDPKWRGLFDTCGAVISVALLVLGLVGRHYEDKRRAASERRRLRALVICDRLERSGRGLPGATREELEALSDALHDQDDSKRKGPPS